MNLQQAIDYFQNNPEFKDNIVYWRTFPAVPGDYKPFPEPLDNRIVDILKGKNIYRFYSHQLESFELAQSKDDFVVVTPTASGKSL